ncbi:magnesium transporter CorA family protein, partial [Patescibacteria group bacterium]|nr:magnesium transporter CorA family protein [Patescibacteria group bacterium]
KETKCLGKTWIDIANPTKSQIRQIQEKYKLHDADIKECIDKIQIAKTYEHPTYMFIVIHAGIQIDHHQIIIEEIDIFFSKRFIITIHDRPFPIIDRVIEKLADPRVKHPHLKKNQVYVLFELIRKISNNNLQIINQIVSDVSKIEKQLLTGEYKTSITEILKARRNVLQIKAITQPNQVVTKEILKSKILTNYPGSQVYFDALIEYQEKTLNIVSHYKDFIDGLTDINNIIANHRLNEIMRTLTIISVALLPLTLIAGILGMNFIKFDLFSHPYGFYLTIFFMIVLEIIIIQYFKYKKWL